MVDEVRKIFTDMVLSLFREIVRSGEGAEEWRVSKARITFCAYGGAGLRTERAGLGRW